MRTFNKPKLKVDEPKRPRNHLKAKLVAIAIVFLALVAFFGFFVYVTVEYYETHTFTPQTPVIIQAPIIIKRVEIISPLASQSAHLGIAYAQEIKNPFDPRSPKGVGFDMVMDKWGIQEWGYFEELIQRESGWNPYSINTSSGACGLGQALPCSKLGVELWDYEGQLTWIIQYISNRYGEPVEALNFHNAKNYY